MKLGFFFKILFLPVIFKDPNFFHNLPYLFIGSKNSVFHFFLFFIFVYIVNKFFLRNFFLKLLYTRARGIVLNQPYEIMYTSTIPLLSSVIFFYSLRALFFFFNQISLYHYKYFRYFVDFFFKFGAQSDQYPVIGGLFWIFKPFETFEEIPLIFKGNYLFLIRFIFNSLFLIFFCIALSYLWVVSSTLSPQYQSESFFKRKITFPGFRVDKRIIENKLSEVFIPLSFLSGFLLGLGSVIFGIFGIFGGVQAQIFILSIMIFNSLLKKILEEQILEYYPHMKEQIIR